MQNLRMNSQLFLCLLAANFWLVHPVKSQIPERPESWVSDYANILSASELQLLNARLKSLEDSSSTQIFVAIFPTLPENYYLEDFTNRLFETWRPGLKQEDNGVLLTIFVNDRKLRIEVGYGLEDVLTDAQSGTVINDYIVPYFKKGDYFAGVNSGLDVIISAVEGKFNIPAESRNESENNSISLGIILLAVFIFMVLLRNSRRRYATTFSRTGSRNHPWDGPIFWGGPFRGGGSGGGSFGGGFGGLSGGGGASGSW